MAPQNPIERIVLRTLTLTWPFYAIGALYVVGPVLAWTLGALALVILYLGPAVRQDMRARGSIPLIVWVWITGMAMMLVVLWIGHMDWGLGLKQTIKSSIGWAKGWALLALFPLIGAVLPIRRAILVRGQCIIGLWTLILAPLMLVAPYVGLPDLIFTSPLKAVGGPGPEYFSVYLFTWDPASWTPRWQFYAPWSPFAALLGVIMLIFALEDRSPKWRAIGVAAGLLMIFASKSRMGLVGVVACTVGPRMMPLILRGWAWQMVAALVASLAVFGSVVFGAAMDFVSAFKGARADSTRVRATLQRIASERWQNEAFWFGHGTVQPGSHAVEYMPIGSHHTWFGLLFVKGLVGMVSLVIPFVWQMTITMLDAARSKRGYLPMGIMMTFTLLSFGENIEIEAYLLWPAMMMLGIHARELAEARGRANASAQPEKLVGGLVEDSPASLHRL
ncbi:O-antigen ligase domain-containing protein [Tateyamaria pelophila]|uniref:O-antigen ligase domain-containing protein n=1 Tax=Tateyamaria pelophila TaxID=328415 RepID=UPI001CBC8F02|nr:O-antigen ligase domain-containing protein [Tateyamaria pelophila]